MNEMVAEQQFDEFKLVHDLLRVTGKSGYGREFRLELLKPYEFEIFRIYLMFQGKEYPTRIELRAYPFGGNSLPKVVFESLLPFCAVHPGNRHPNITDAGQVDWGAVRVAPGVTITIAELLTMLRTLLTYPDHYSAFRSCSPHILSMVRAGEVVPHQL